MGQAIDNKYGSSPEILLAGMFFQAPLLQTSRMPRAARSFQMCAQGRTCSRTTLIYSSVSSRRKQNNKIKSRQTLLSLSSSSFLFPYISVCSLISQIDGLSSEKKDPDISMFQGSWMGYRLFQLLIRTDKNAKSCMFSKYHTTVRNFCRH